MASSARSLPTTLATRERSFSGVSGPFARSIKLNNRYSSAVVPTTRCTSAAAPSCTALRGWVGSTLPSTTGANGRRSAPTAMIFSVADAWAARSVSTGSSSTPSALAVLRPSSASTVSATSEAVSTSLTDSAAPLCGMALRIIDGTPGTPSSVATLIPPADSPNSVMLSGSPPKDAMFSRTHAMAAIWSRMPLFAAPANSLPNNGSTCRNPNTPRR